MPAIARLEQPRQLVTHVAKPPSIQVAWLNRGPSTWHMSLQRLGTRLDFGSTPSSLATKKPAAVILKARSGRASQRFLTTPLVWPKLASSLASVEGGGPGGGQCPRWPLNLDWPACCQENQAHKSTPTPSARGSSHPLWGGGVPDAVLMMPRSRVWVRAASSQLR